MFCACFMFSYEVFSLMHSEYDADENGTVNTYSPTSVQFVRVMRAVLFPPLSRLRMTDSAAKGHPPPVRRRRSFRCGRRSVGPCLEYFSRLPSTERFVRSIFQRSVHFVMCRDLSVPHSLSRWQVRTFPHRFRRRSSNGLQRGRSTSRAATRDLEPVNSLQRVRTEGVDIGQCTAAHIFSETNKRTNVTGRAVE